MNIERNKHFAFLKNWAKNLKDPTTAIEVAGAIITGGFLTALLGLPAYGGYITKNYDISTIYSLTSLLNLIYNTAVATKLVSGKLYKK